LRKVKSILKYLLGVAFIAAGFNHFINPTFYLSIMPPYIPWHSFMVYLSGALEIALGIMVFIPRLTTVAAWGLIALLIVVFPANVHMALNPQLYPGFAPFALWVRLPLQLMPILWAYWYTRPDQQNSIKHPA